MGKIKIELPNESFFVEIAGEEPTVAEELKIAELIGSKKQEVQAQSNVRRSEQGVDSAFDTETGVKSGSLRAVLSMAETAEEEDAKLTDLFGLSKDTDFLRDNRGRLAPYPRGRQKGWR